MIGPADEDGGPAVSHLLKMALEAEVGIAHGQHLGVDAAMGGVAGSATFLHRLVLKHIRTALGWMTFKTIVRLREQGGAAPGQDAAFVR